jgi:hypothetical protein
LQDIGLARISQGGGRSKLIGADEADRVTDQAIILGCCAAHLNSEMGHFRPNQPGFAFGPHPLRPESNRSTALPQSVAMCQNRTHAVQHTASVFDDPIDAFGAQDILTAQKRPWYRIVHHSYALDRRSDRDKPATGAIF